MFDRVLDAPLKLAGISQSVLVPKLNWPFTQRLRIKKLKKFSGISAVMFKCQ